MMENGRKLILFQGDSITDAGRNKTNAPKNFWLGDGYVTMIAGELLSKHPEFDILNRGVGGNRVADIYGRWQEDTLNIKYDILSLLCGINDVGFGLRLGRGSDPDRFEFIYDRMLYEAKEVSPDAKLVLCQPFLLKIDVNGTNFEGEFGNDIFRNWSTWDTEIKKRDEVVKKMAQKYNAIYVPFGDALHKAEEVVGADKLTMDCIHLTPAGNYILAKTWLEETKELLD